MLVRAKVKAEQFFPDWAKCCPEFLQYAEKHRHRTFTVDLDTVFTASVGCHFCGNTVDAETAGPSVRSPEVRRSGCLALLDLDEGPLEAA